MHGRPEGPTHALLEQRAVVVWCVEIPDAHDVCEVGVSALEGRRGERLAQGIRLVPGVPVNRLRLAVVAGHPWRLFSLAGLLITGQSVFKQSPGFQSR